VVFGPWSPRYDFGPGHPLTPERFGPGISLLEALGADRFLAPEPASDEQLRLVHTQRYIDAVRGAPDDAFTASFFGLGPGDNPIFEGMHDAAAAVAGGSLAAMELVLSGTEAHAFHPGGGLHHAMSERASGFCVYNDPALGIARARRDGLRVLYVDLDVHHGDGVEAAFWDDPAVMTVSLHESGRYLFPGTGFVEERGGRDAVGTKVNVPFEPGTTDDDWLAALERLVPPLATRHAPDVVVSQHGCDSHAYDPLAHLLLTTSAYRRATGLVHDLAHELCGGRWLATGGGGYDVHRVVPRSWAIVWTAQAHLEQADEVPRAWRERWGDAAERRGQSPLPEHFADAPLARPPLAGVREQNARTLARLVELLGLTD
jgi:acetoin utilization protein AcuC